METNYSDMINSGIDSLFHNLAQRISADDMARVRDAYNLASEAHSNQRRKSGEPYIIHPISVAQIVSEELRLGANPIIAAFLHDVVEDTDYTIDDIRKRFGDDVAFLVGVVTKQKKESYEHSKQVDNYRQILASVQYDVRAILIKLADRLHNMRTLESMRADKQMKIAGETDYFYAPLANRLGLYHTKIELENLSFRYRCPREYDAIERQLVAYKQVNAERIASFIDRITSAISAIGIDVSVQVLYRTPYTIWRKMQNSGRDFHHIDGKHYIRIVYNSQYTVNQQLDCFDKCLKDEKLNILLIYAELTNHFKEQPGSVSNYIDSPKENGYQSFHVRLFNEQGAWEEVHISSKRMVRNSQLGCTAERTEENVLSWIDKFKDVLHDVAYHSQEMDYMDGVTASFYNDDIRVFTPKGKGIILPKGATAIDFAYEIHSQVGEHAVFARINGKLSSIKTVLHRGDCVEIGTDPQSHPDVDWIDHVITYKAKRNLRSLITNRVKLDYERCPDCRPLPGDEVVGFKSANGSVTLHKRNCATAIRLASQQGDSIVAVDFRENADLLYPVTVCVQGVDRYHLLSDLVECISERHHLTITKLFTENSDRIATCNVDFAVHSAAELRDVMSSLSSIKGVDEVYCIAVK